MSVFDRVLIVICAIWIAVAVGAIIRRKIRRKKCENCGGDCVECRRKNGKK